MSSSFCRASSPLTGARSSAVAAPATAPPKNAKRIPSPVYPLLSIIAASPLLLSRRSPFALEPPAPLWFPASLSPLRRAPARPQHREEKPPAPQCGCDECCAQRLRENRRTTESDSYATRPWSRHD